MELFIYTYIFVVGLIFGSFFNVVILRPFTNESIVTPPSKCPKCNHKLAWYDNIPLFSYLILGAKCRYCKAPIHWQYPLVEFITGVLFLCSFIKFGPTIQAIIEPTKQTFFIPLVKFIFVAAELGFFVIMSGTDFKEQIVFDKHAICFIAISIIYGLITGNYLDMFLGLVVGAVIMELLARSGYIFAGTRAFGEGDTYIAAGLGAFLGLKGIIITIVLAAIVQSLWAIPMLIKKYFVNKKYFAIITLSMLVVLIPSFYLMNNLGYFDNMWIYFGYMAILLTCTGFTCINLIKSMQLEGGGLYMPFGPALFLGATVMIFFSEEIIKYLSTYIPALT